MNRPLLAGRDLHRHFGGIRAVRGVNLEVEQGELRCIIGPNGAGKSTLLNMLCGTLAPSSGSIELEGKSLIGLKLHEFVREGVSRKFQVPSVFETMTVQDNLEVARPGRYAGSRPVPDIDEVLELLGLADHAETRAGELAHGQKQWLEVGMALVTAPKLLLLDEPTAGAGAEETRRLIGILQGLKRRTTIVLVEHDMQAVFALADRISVLVEGRIIATGSPAAIRADPAVRRAYLGEAA
jgi:branched-chain amino acid transport system ATP-binding protein